MILISAVNRNGTLPSGSAGPAAAPTSAAIVLAYLAFTQPEFRPLYEAKLMSRADFTRHIEAVYEYVTPGTMGLNRLDMFSDGVRAFAQSRGLTLTPHTFASAGRLSDRRSHVAELMDFVKAGFAADCPLGFLNLARGRVNNLQNWHWITISCVEMENDSLIAVASDEGRRIRFDLLLWYLSTRMHGGLVYFTKA